MIGREIGRSCAARGKRMSVVKRSRKRVIAAFSGVKVPEKAGEGKRDSSLERMRRVSAYTSPSMTQIGMRRYLTPRAAIVGRGSVGGWSCGCQ